MDTMPMDPVVVGVDGSLLSMRALDLAAEEATGRVVPLVVVYTVRQGLDSGVLDQHRRLLDIAVGEAVAEHPGLSVSPTLVGGEPADALVGWSRRARLVVVGHDSGHAGDSVAATVAAAAATPVLVYRPFRHSQYGHQRPVLLGVDVTAAHDASVEFAFEEADLRGAPLTAMYVSGPTDPQTRVQALAALAEAVSVWSEKYPHIELRTVVVEGTEAVTSLAQASDEAALLVVGVTSRGEPGKLIDTAGCPVAAVPVR
jgi:nucleotide-binding universal stress UspA family protein